MPRHSRLKQQPLMKVHKFTCQLGSSADLGRPQPFLTELTPISVSTVRLAGRWHVYNDLTHMLEQLAENWVICGTDPCSSLPLAS